MRRIDPKEAVAAGLLLVAGLLFRLSLSREAPLPVDSLRFLAQSRDLAAGARWLLPGDPFSVLPPGYPLFIRATAWIRPGIPFLLKVQFALSIGTLLLVWLAARRRSQKGALVALALLAFNPWLARQQALVMSETLGALLVGATALLWPAPGPPLGGPRGFALGALAVAASLVTPAASFVVVPALGVLAWRNRRRALTPALMAAGLLLALAPWQAFLLARTGRVEPLLLHPIGTLRAGLQQWLRTWSVTPSEKGVWWSPEARREIPDRALGEGPGRELLLKALDEAPYRYPDYVAGSGYDETFREAAGARRAAQPVLCGIGLPAARSATLWLDYRSLIGVPERLRYSDGLLRAAFWLTHAAFWGVNLLTLGIFGWGAFRAVGLRDALLVGVVLGTLVYSFASGASAMGEFRRNLTLLPALALLVCAVPASRTPEEAGS